MHLEKILTKNWFTYRRSGRVRKPAVKRAQTEEANQEKKSKKVKVAESSKRAKTSRK
jgi:hypothetical protein